MNASLYHFLSLINPIETLSLYCFEIRITATHLLLGHRSGTFPLACFALPTFPLYFMLAALGSTTQCYIRVPNRPDIFGKWRSVENNFFSKLRIDVAVRK
jgi:hypothetical protein